MSCALRSVKAALLLFTLLGRGHGITAVEQALKTATGAHTPMTECEHSERNTDPESGNMSAASGILLVLNGTQSPEERRHTPTTERNKKHRERIVNPENMIPALRNRLQKLRISDHEHCARVIKALIAEDTQWKQVQAEEAAHRTSPSSHSRPTPLPAALGADTRSRGDCPESVAPSSPLSLLSLPSVDRAGGERVGWGVIDACCGRSTSCIASETPRPGSLTEYLFRPEDETNKANSHPMRN